MSATNDGRNPRSVALVGPYGSGKSTLFEALLEAAGSPVKRPADPRNRPPTTEIRLGHCTYLGDPWSILDCPGSIEFAFQACAALTVTDLAVVVCEPIAAKAATVGPLLKTLKDAGIPHIVFLNKIDTLDGGLPDTLAALQAYAACPLVVRHMPIHEGANIAGYVDLVSERAYRYRKGQPSELMQIPVAMLAEEQDALGRLVETLADHDDALLEKVLDDVKPTPEELYRDLRKDLLNGHVIEVMVGAAENANGVRRLWKALRHDAPDPAQTAARKAIDLDGPPLAQVFRTVFAGHTGKLSYARVWSGSIPDGAHLGGARLGGIYKTIGGELNRIAEARQGDLVAFGRLDGICSGATVSLSGMHPAGTHGSGSHSPGTHSPGAHSPGAHSPGAPEPLPFVQPPSPVYALAITTIDRKDDVKLSGALHRLTEEDPALFVSQDKETGETVLHGQGEMHLQTTIEHLARNCGLKLATKKPLVPYKESIRRAVHEHGRLKRQTGGHGQFADVRIEVAPRARGEGFEFIDKIVGGAVPRNFIPAVGEAAEEATRKGPFGYPVVDIAVTLVDGGFHSVDSSDMAFRTATHLAMKEALANADPILLEPVDHVTICVPNEYTARAQRLLTGRRGQILGYAERPGWPGWDDVEAMVPAAELHDLIIELRSQTMGLGTYRKRFDHLAETRAVPG